MIFSIMLCNCVGVRADDFDLNVSVSLSRGGSVSNLSGTITGNDSWTARPTISTQGATYHITGYNTDSVQVGQTTSSRTSYAIHTRLQYAVSLPEFQFNHMYHVTLSWSNGNPYPSAPSGGSVSMTGREFTFIFSGREYTVAANSSFVVTGSVGNTGFFFVDCDWAVTTPIGTSEVDTYGLNYIFRNFSVNVVDYGYYSTDVAGAVDSVNQSVQQTTSAVQQGNQLQQEANNLQQEANETNKGILGQITDFFGSFFENIINAVKSLFIPEDGYFSDFFQRLNDFFSEKLGMLYAPIDLFVEILTAILNASPGTAGVPFPGVKWDDTWLIEPQTIGLPVDEFPELQEKLYFVTDVIMIGAVLMLVQNKYREVMGT